MSSSASPPVLLFDVMGTLVYNPFYKEVPGFFGMSLKRLLALKDPDAWIEFEEGKIDEKDYFRRYFIDRRGFDHNAFRVCVRNAYRWVEGMEALLGDIRDGGRQMHILSNYPSWYETVEERLGLSRYLPWAFVSCRTGVRKPAPEAYTSPLRQLHLRASEVLLIDDSIDNCRGAETAGIPTILFENAGSLRKELTSRDVI